MDELNQDSKVNGILVQLPLPSQINNEKILEAISPQKDVDGFHPKNVGLLSLGRPQFIPCTPLGIMKILQEYDVSLEGMNAVIVGRSNIVGKPMAQLLLKENATVTLCHSRTKNLAQILSQAELVVAAIGKAKFIHGKDLKPQVVVVDVGINRLDSGKLVGDVDFESAYEKARFITPVPGGVGPLTIACLLENTLKAAKMPAKV
jgi:methylenetetrahydrofolate dehydrogenase (NADP+)/methenyltetrahydrofolate cyclohydrolase